jgi:hypothetical protein
VRRQITIINSAIDKPWQQEKLEIKIAPAGLNTIVPNKRGHA